MRGSVHDRVIVLRDVVITAGNGNLATLQDELTRLRELYDTAISKMRDLNQQYPTTSQELKRPAVNYLDRP